MPTTISLVPSGRQAPSSTQWVKRCVKRLQHLGPLLDDHFAEELAVEIYRAWPALVPEDAAAEFLRPERIAA